MIQKKFLFSNQERVCHILLFAFDIQIGTKCFALYTKS